MIVTYAPFDASDYLDTDEVISEYLALAGQDDNPLVLQMAVEHVAKARACGAAMTSNSHANAPYPIERAGKAKGWH